MTVLTDTAPAKINLSLHVGPPKANGRHDLISLVTFADDAAADTLTARPAAHFSLAVEGPYAEASGPARDNLVLQAARAMDEALDGSAPKLAFRLDKQLPCTAGIGGGSADAGAALRLIARAHGGESALEAAKAVAPMLGGDVLACLIGAPGLMSGEGETYEPMLGIPRLPAVLVNSSAECPTGSVFRAYDDTAPSTIPDHPLPPAGRARSENFIGWLAENTQNSLQTAAPRIAPSVDILLAALKNLPNARLVRMSGSGETCYALFDSMDQAEHGASLIQSAQPDWWVRATLLGGG
ncbi:MAG: 4-(cytidine 5'-diphospho)-2-C-methyl-D-erythritol kinase [Pseudomonadota bacterium]